MEIDRHNCYYTGQNGVISAIDVDPNNHNIVFAASLAGNLWKSTDKGLSWSESLVKNLPLIKVFNDIEIAKSNSNIIYAATDVGVIKSIDGGNNFSMTTIDYSTNFPNLSFAGDGYKNEYLFLDVANDNPNKIVATDINPNDLIGKIAVSQDGGQNWIKTSFGKYHFPTDILFHPTQSNIIYALVRNYTTKHYEFYKSTNTGKTFSLITNGLPVENNPKDSENKARLAVSSAQPDLVAIYYHVQGLGYGFYRSTDKGSSFSKVCCGGSGINKSSNTRDFFGEGMGAVQIRWATKFEISDTDANFVVAATNCPPRSSYNQMQSWYWFPDKSNNYGAPSNIKSPVSRCSTKMHGDIKDIVIRGNDVWVANDGGLVYSSNKGKTYVERADGLPLTMVLGFDMTQGKKDVIVSAMDHNGVVVKDDAIYNGKWKPLGGGDASNASINPIDDLWLYTRPSWRSVVQKRPNYGPSHKHPREKGLEVNLGSGYAKQFNNVQFHPNEYYKLFAIDYIGKRVVKSNDNGTSFETLLKLDLSDDYSSYAEVKVSLSNPDILYVTESSPKVNNVFYSSDGGTNWSNISPNISGKFRNIEIDSKNPNIAWLSLNNGNTPEVYKTTNGGKSWEKYSSGIKGFYIYSMIHQKGSNGGVYIGTKNGVYYRDANLTSWQKYGNLLRSGAIRFLKINYAHNKLRAGTQAGIWENHLYNTYSPLANIAVNKKSSLCGETISFADHSAAGLDATYQWSFPGGTPSSSTLERPSVTYNKSGLYNVTLTVTDSKGTNSMTLNDIKINGNNCITQTSCNDGILNGTEIVIDCGNSKQYIKAYLRGKTIDVAMQGSYIGGTPIISKKLSNTISSGNEFWVATYNRGYTKAVKIKIENEADGIKFTQTEAKYVLGNKPNFNFDKKGSTTNIAVNDSDTGYGVKSIKIKNQIITSDYLGIKGKKWNLKNTICSKCDVVSSNTCSDGILNGTETEIDCGNSKQYIKAYLRGKTIDVAMQGSYIGGTPIISKKLSNTISSGNEFWVATYNRGYTKAVKIKIENEADGIKFTQTEAKYVLGNKPNFNFDKKGSTTNIAVNDSDTGYGVKSIKIKNQIITSDYLGIKGKVWDLQNISCHKCNTNKPIVFRNDSTKIINNSIKNDDYSLLLNEFNIYPNPTKDILYITSLNPILTYSIKDENNEKIVPNTKVTNNSINISHLSTGLYILKLIDSKKNIIVTKVIKEE